MDRRRFLGAAGVAVGTALAGCSSGSESGDGSTTGTSGTTSSGSDGTPADRSVEVTMKPVGTVALDSVPSTIAPYSPGYADMAVALGHGDAVASAGLPSRYHTYGYDEIDGVSMATSSLTKLVDGGVDTEVFFDIGADLHLIDPNWLVNNFSGVEQSDVETVRDRVAPFLGNTIFRRTDDWHDYPYYTMYEAFGKVAQVLGETDTYESFAAFHDEFVGGLQSRLPDADDRPEGALVWAGSDEPKRFYPYLLGGQGTNKKHFHDLGVSDAFSETGIEGLSTNDRGQIDYETLLEVDPEALFVRGHEGKSRTEFENTVVSFMQDHRTASQITAVENGAVYRGGPIYQGPLQNLFLTERFATLLYPETFTESELFDRAKVSDIVQG